jgi:hypothetical protein
LTRTRDLGGKLLLLVAALTMGALLCEGLVRYLFGEQPKFPRRVVEGPFGLRINQPGAHYRHRSADVNVSFRINAAGLRADREYVYGHPPGTTRIVFLGDSFTVGYEVDIEDCFTSVVERELRSRGHSVEALNAGVSGFGTAEEYLYLERDLIRYSPDVVVLSFYGNDLVDNLRSDLFVLEQGQLRTNKTSYVPLGRIGNFLNTNFVFGLLSERSDAFTVLKEGATRMLKGRMARQNVAVIAASAPGPEAAEGTAGTREDVEYMARLTGAILERLYRFTRQRGIALVIQSIPTVPPEQTQLLELFPFTYFDVSRPGVYFVSGKKLLDPYRGQQLLYWARSTGHWTPFSHRVSGRALADLIESQGLLVDKGEGGPTLQRQVDVR